MKHESANLDLLRTIAVSLVVLSHLLLALNEGPIESLNLYALGHIGVAIFFVHTTLVLLQSMGRNGADALPFYVRRIFRIYPLAILAVLVMAFIRLAGNAPVNPWQVLSNVFLVQNITGHESDPRQLWSLAYEVQMYLVLPLLFALAIKRNAVPLVATLYAACVLFALSLPTPWLQHQLVRFVPCFLPGVLAFALLGRVKPVFGPWVLFSVVGCGAVAIPLLVAAKVPETQLLWIISLAIGVTIPLCRDFQDGTIARASKLVAMYSYGVYATHDFALWPLLGLMPGPWFVQLGAFLVLLVGLPYIVYHRIEKPGIEMGRRLADRLQKRQSAPAEAGAGVLPGSRATLP